MGHTSSAISDTDIRSVLSSNGYYNYTDQEINDFLNFLYSESRTGDSCTKNNVNYYWQQTVDTAWNQWPGRQGSQGEVTAIGQILDQKAIPFNFFTCA